MNTLKLLKRGYHSAKNVINVPARNKKFLDGKSIERGRVNLEWVDNGNLGDTLGPQIYRWMIQKEGISESQTAKDTYHLLTCGSLIGLGMFDAVVWGSGIHTVHNIENLITKKGIREYDIRAVRGPVTRQILTDCGYSCPEIFGDPAILMPYIYSEVEEEKKYDISVVLHYRTADAARFRKKDLHYINIGTDDFEGFIKEVKSSEKIISSSLHGIILAETYGIPTVFLNSGGYIDQALMKYYDWYYSTNRWSVKMARSIEEAVEMEPMPLPKLQDLQIKLMAAFPYDLWETASDPVGGGHRKR